MKWKIVDNVPLIFALLLLGSVLVSISYHKTQLPVLLLTAAVFAGFLVAAPLGLLKWDPVFAFVSFRVFGFIVAAALFGYLTRHRSDSVNLMRRLNSPWGFLLAGLPAIAAIWGLIIGVLRANNVLLAVGDTSKLLLSALAVLAGICLGYSQRSRDLAVVSLSAVAVSEIALLVLYAMPSVVGQSAGFRSGGFVPALLAGGIVLLIAATRSQNTSLAVLAFFVIAVELGVAARSLTKITWLAAAFTLLLGVGAAAVIWNDRRTTLRLIVVAGAATLATVAIATYASGFTEPIERRIEATLSGRSVQVSTDVRLDEIRYSDKRLRDLAMGDIVGAGAGATYEFPPLGESSRHQIHILYANFLFRHGGVGVAIFSVWIAASLYVSVRTYFASRGDYLALWAGITVLGTIVNAAASQRFVGDPIAGFAVGLCAACVMARTLESRRIVAAAPLRQPSGRPT